MVPQITDILTSIFQYPIDTGTLPLIWKQANVPIHKGGNNAMPNNYRPVSLTPMVCKMIENIVLHYLNKYLGDILCTNQHGLRRGLSRNTQLITVMHQIFEFVDDVKTVQIVTFDFAQAFNMVSHRALIDKLHKFFVSEQIINCIEKFLKLPKQ